jgi:N-acetylmuramoyl-L-alanine amidase
MAEEKFNMRLTILWWCILLVGAMCAMFYVSMNKTIVIADGSYRQGSAGGNGENTEWNQKLDLEGTENGTGTLRIPLEKNTKAENVVVENCYMDRELHIFIQDAENAFYAQNCIQGDVANVYMACRVEQSGGVLLKMKMDGVYEYKTSMEGDVLKVQICQPHELYRLIVVVDPVGDDARTQVSKMASEIAMEVSSLLSEKWESEDIRLYFTRVDDTEVTREQCVELVESVKADMFLHINVAQAEDEQQYGICGWYNELYFIPEFGNVELADIVTKNVTIASGNRAVGLKAADEESILQDIRVPAAEIDLGYLTNPQERSLLSQSAYRDKLADGIADAIREVYSSYYE